jgi:hypothetical protein
LAIALLGCSGSPEPTKTPVEPEPAQSSWTLRGRVTPDSSPLPDAPPFAGGRTLVRQCDSIRPCAAEQWVLEGDPEQIKVLLRRGPEVYQEDGTLWVAQWWTVSGILRACMGDPLSLPPTADPGAYRSLVTSEQGSYWWIHLTGENACGLDGVLKLKVDEDKIDLAQLTCDGRPWKRGGRQCAMKKRSEARPLKSTSEKP